jgi:hypothetical protein
MSGDQTVMPAQRSGAAAARSRDLGIASVYSSSHTMYSEYPPNVQYSADAWSALAPRSGVYSGQWS